MSVCKNEESQVDRYRRLRASGRKLISKMYEAANGPEFDIIKAAKKLTIPSQHRTLIFESETDSNALADFYLHEMRFGGKRIVDAVATMELDLTSDERALLEAHRESRCSLFAINGTNPTAAQVRLRDLLETGTPQVALTDINLSQCPAIEAGDLLFLRLVRCADIVMGAGLNFGFRAVHRIHLLNAYRERMRTVDQKDRAQRRYIFFYQKYRKFGMEQAYEEVT